MSSQNGFGRGGESKLGRIVSVKMTDFVTYDSVVCTPGKGLNVVIGPNGSGKSTLLNAIVLGLGGKTSVIGRASKVEHYIKTGRNEAKIEIELEGEKKNIKIVRTIYKDGKSTWLLNGKNVSLKEVDKLAKSLNIQIDNLCQVLPQDRVQDFAKLNKQELLESTQKAVGKEAMSQIHSCLKALQKQQKELTVSLEKDRKRHEQEDGHVNRLKGAVEKVEKRQGIEREIEACKSKLDILKYKVKREECLRFKQQRIDIATKMREMQLKLEPHQKLIDEAKRKCVQMQNRYTGMDKRVQDTLQEVRKKEKAIEDKRHEIIEVEVAKDTKLRDIGRQKEDADKLRQKISRIRNTMASLKQMPKAEQEAKAAMLLGAIDELAHKLSDVKQQKIKKETSIEQDHRALQDVTINLQKLADVKNARLRTLQQFNKDAYHAAMWVEQNRDKFEKNVFLPMCVELNVQDPQFARYVEMAIGNNDLVALTCESKADFTLVVEELRRKQKLRINVLHADPQPDNYRPAMDLNTLNQLCPGFHGYLKDFVSGPQTLISWLCRQKHFHTIPVGNETVNAERVPKEISLYYAGDFKRSAYTSRYTGNLVSISDPVHNARYLVNPSDPQELQTLGRRSQNLNQSLRIAKEERESLILQMDKLETDRKSKRTELSEIQSLQSSYQTHQFQLGQKERELKTIENRCVDPQKVHEECAAAVKNLVLELLELQEPYYKSLNAIEKGVQESQVLEFSLQAAAVNVKNQNMKCQKEQENLNNVKATLEEINNTHADLRTDAKRFLDAFERRVKKKIDVFKSENEALLSTLPGSIEELDNHVEEMTARAEMLGGPNDAEVFREYQGHVKQLADLDNSIKKKELESERLITEMNNKQTEWKKELNDLVSKINVNFMKYFQAMNCAGTVELYMGNNEHDYDNYGLRIRVKFRETDELQDLNAYTQSGGERAVTTAIFMLSLQELTPVPFRLVDEINQGMDPINERRVYELLLKSTSQPDTPQYFLLTPKLLKDMSHSDSMTVLIILNSSCAPDYRLWDVNTFIQLRGRLNGMNNGSHCMDNGAESEED